MYASTSGIPASAIPSITLSVSAVDDALRIVSHGANTLRTPDRAILLVTHYQRMLNYIAPDYVHVMIDGRIVKTGDKSLALELEEKGYEWVDRAFTQPATA